MATYAISAISLEARPTAVVRGSASLSELGGWLAAAFGAVAAYLGATGASLAGPPFARFHRLGEDRFAVEAGFPVSAPVEGGGEVDGGGEVVPSLLPGGPAVRTLHLGAYQEMEGAYSAILDWLDTHGATAAGDAWEVYLSDPSTSPDPATWRTEVVQPAQPASGDGW